MTTTVSASAVIVREDPWAEHDVLGMHRTATAGRAPEASRGAPMLTTPIPSVGGCQEPRGDWTLRGAASGLAGALKARGRGDSDIFVGSGRGCWTGVMDSARDKGPGGVGGAVGLGVDSAGASEAFGVGVGT